MARVLNVTWSVINNVLTAVMKSDIPASGFVSALTKDVNVKKKHRDRSVMFLYPFIPEDVSFFTFKRVIQTFSVPSPQTSKG